MCVFICLNNWVVINIVLIHHSSISCSSLLVVQEIKTFPHTLFALQSQSTVFKQMLLVHLYYVLFPRYYLVYFLFLDSPVGFLLQILNEVDIEFISVL